MATTGDRQTLSADGQTTPRQFAGPVRVSLTGDFGGGTLKIQSEDPSAAFVDVAGASRIAADDFIIDFPPGAQNKLRSDLAGSTTPALVITIQGVDRGP